MGALRLAAASSRRTRLVRLALGVTLLGVLGAAFSQLSSQAAMVQSGGSMRLGDSLQAPAGSSGGVAAAAQATNEPAAATAAGQQQQQQPGTQQRHVRPPELDQAPKSGMLGLAAAQAAAQADAPAPVPVPGVIPRILHRIYIADPKDEKR